MKTVLAYIFLTITLLLLMSFILNEREQFYESEIFWNLSSDTTVIGNTSLGSGGKIMTDQDALVAVIPTGHKISGISLFYSSVSNVVSDSSRLFVKTERSWSCAPLGNAHPFQIDQFTIGLTNNLKVSTGWNHYSFDVPLDVNVDTIYIWPDLLQQVQPRVVYAQGNNPSLGNLSGTLCATTGSDISLLDYTSELMLTASRPCLPSLLVTDSDSVCYAADTLVARTQIDGADSIFYLSKDEVVLDTTFSIDSSGFLLIDMTGCL